MIAFAAANTLSEYLNSNDPEPGEIFCSICNSRLWRHGRRKRKCQSLAVCAVLSVIRMLCGLCGKTFSLLPSFLEPRRRYERAVHEEYVSLVVSKESTYREAAWSEADGDNQDAAASLARAYRAGEQACKSSTEDLLTVQQALLESGVEPEFEDDLLDCPSAARAHGQMKQQQMRLLHHLFAMLEHHFSDSEGAICHAYRSLCLGFRLPTPHATQQALF